MIYEYSYTIRIILQLEECLDRFVKNQSPNIVDSRVKLVSFGWAFHEPIWNLVLKNLIEENDYQRIALIFRQCVRAPLSRFNWYQF